MSSKVEAWAKFGVPVRSPCRDLRMPFHPSDSQWCCLNCGVLGHLHSVDGWRAHYEAQAARRRRRVNGPIASLWPHTRRGKSQPSAPWDAIPERERA